MKSEESTLAAGVDVGSSAVKFALVQVAGNGAESVLALCNERVRRRELRKVIKEGYEVVLEAAGVSQNEIAYTASTGEGELVDFRRGHFYGMTTHARGAVFLLPGSGAVIDIGALHARAMRVDERSRVMAYRMTNQCASGSGQFLENVARYLGIMLEDVGPLSCEAKNPEMVSSICAVLAETDVINMVSRGISLLRSIGACGDVAITGGLAADIGLCLALEEKITEEKLAMRVRTHPDSVYAGAIGAALWGAYRHRVLARRSEVVA